MVIVRCPLCGGWIVGDAYDAHEADVHAKGAQTAAQGLQVPIQGGRSDFLKHTLEEAATEPGDLDLIARDAALELLDELERHRQAGHLTRLGFRIYE